MWNFLFWPPPTPLGDLHQKSGDNAKKLDLAETIFLVQSRASGRPSLSRYGQTLFLSDVEFRPEPPTHLPISTFLSIFEKKHLTLSALFGGSKLASRCRILKFRCAIEIDDCSKWWLSFEKVIICLPKKKPSQRFPAATASDLPLARRFAFRFDARVPKWDVNVSRTKWKVSFLLLLLFYLEGLTPGYCKERVHSPPPRRAYSAKTALGA